ncbi:short chain dehydrogenase [Acrocarpospora pleiomorpha]|uniref:Short chain dehydrogenase n=1 Tax=Acrocarpospora pleiomorpha TaxID=90975 RepID=A0A5M3XLH2_9ACTN|nr:glucose 1-dehydrogenase [Acrocarpospora pleiomorpha]GES20003.1 short chain dehydrogenase [Acrocarpospora pleiomorpha]
MKELDGRIAFITGAASGMGRATALLMASHGATVIVSDLDEAGAKAVVDEITQAGGSGVAKALDVTSPEQITACMDSVGAQFGHLDVLYANAGTPGATGHNVSQAEYDFSVGVNLTGAYFAAQQAIPLLNKSPHTASILFTASTAGLVGSFLSPLYSMSKGGVVMLAKALALSLAPKIRVNVICPGPIDTPMLPRFWSREKQEGVEERLDSWVANDIPLKRRGRPEEIAEAALFLAGDRASFITGVALPVDGGFTAR